MVQTPDGRSPNPWLPVCPEELGKGNQMEIGNLNAAFGNVKQKRSLLISG